MQAELLEDRTAPAAFSVLGDHLQIDLGTNETVGVTTNGTSYQFALTAGTWGGSNGPAVTGSGTATLTATAAAFASVRIDDAGTGNKVSFNNSGGSVYASNFTVVLDNTSQGVAFPTNSQTHFGAHNLFIETNRSITLGPSGAVLDSTSGDITLRANQQVTPTSGDFIGIDVYGTIRVTGTGALTLAGRGGDQGGTGGGLQHGISVHNSSTVQGGSAGPVSLRGTGGASPVAQNNGVLIQSSTVTSLGADVEVVGRGGGSGTANNNAGVYVQGLTALVTAGGLGTLTVDGTGGNTTGTTNRGVFIQSGAVVSSSGGDVRVTGRGGGAGSSGIGVDVSANSQVKAGGGGTLTVDGTGSASSAGSQNYGVNVTGSALTSSGGAVEVIGRGGGTGASFNNPGVVVQNAGVVTAGGSGPVTVRGTGGAGSGVQNYGVFVTSGSSTQITSSGGDVLVVGQGGGTGASGTNHGVLVATGAQVLSGGGGRVTIEGTAGVGTGTGVFVNSTNALVTSGGGDVSVTGTPGTGAGSLAVSVMFASISTATNGGSVTVAGDSMKFDTTQPVLAANAASTITLRPKTPGVAVNLGSTTDAAAGTLELSDAELDRVTAGSLQIGDGTVGTITVTAGITRAVPTAMGLTAGGSIVFNPGSLATGGGTLTLTPGPTSSVQPITSGTDVNVASGRLEFAPGTDLAIEVNGTAVNTQYRQLAVAGVVDLTGVELVLSGTYAPAANDTFVVVQNDGTDPVVGAFAGLPEGSLVTINGVRRQITYAGGDGNDVVLARPGPATITSNGGGPAATVVVPEGTTGVTTVSATGEDVTYGLAGGADAARFAIDPSTGVLTFTAPPDFLRPADVGADNTYLVTVRATDRAGGSDTQALTVVIPGATVSTGERVANGAVTMLPGTFIDFTGAADQALTTTTGLTLELAGTEADPTRVYQTGTPHAATLGKGITLRATGAASVIGDTAAGVAGAWSNDGVWEAVGGTLTLAAGNQFTNPGTLEAHAGGTLVLAGSWDNRGTLRVDGGTAVSTAAAVTNTGTVEVVSGLLDVRAGDLRFDAGARLNTGTAGTVRLGGGLLGATTGAALFTPDGAVVFDGAATAAAPQLLEAMGRDLGPVAAGFDGNFSLGTIRLNTTYLRLIDDAPNAGAAPEAVYVDTLVLPAGSTVDLNGLNLYARAVQIDGTVVNGTVTHVPDGGPIAWNTLTPGAVSAAGEADVWTFFARAGQAVTVIADTGPGSTPSPLTPSLDWTDVRLVAPDGRELAAAGSTTAGQPVRLTQVGIPADGTYRARVRAADGQPAATGHYLLTVWNATIDTRPLVVNQPAFGLLETPYSTDRWTFSAAAGRQVRLDVTAAAAPDTRFKLYGPGGWVGFAGLTGDSDPVTLPADGAYTLEVTSGGTGHGGYTFRLNESAVVTLVPGTPYHGTLVGRGDAQLFKVELTGGAPLRLALDDATGGDRTELYVRAGSAPTRQQYAYRSTAVGADQAVLVPMAVPGTWYVLLYGDAVAAASDYTLTATVSPVVIDAVTPDRAPAGPAAELTVTGGGFTPGTRVELLGAATVEAESVGVESVGLLRAAFDLTGVAEGTYDVRVTLAGGASATLPAAFRVEPAGEARFETRLILPAAVGRPTLATFYVEYANTGTAAMPAPVLVVQPADPDGSDRPLLTLDAALLAGGLWSSADRHGLDHTVQIYAGGASPGRLLPGERVLVPVYYTGLLQPWTTTDRELELAVRVHEAGSPDPIDWDGLEAGLRPAWVAPDVWPAVYANLREQIGTTWGDYARVLARNAAYLARLGEPVTDAALLYGFEVRKAVGLDPVGVLTAAVDAAVPVPGLPLRFGRTFGNTLTARSRVGPFGLGWAASWDVSLELRPDGTVVVRESADSHRTFLPDGREPGEYFAQTGDTGVLRRLAGGAFELTEATGFRTRYHPDGRFDSAEDINSNRITAGYSGGRLAGLTHSAGGWITLGYNAAGRVASLADSTGRVTTYTYDPTGTHLHTATGPEGTTTYAYEGDPGPRANALLAVTGPDGRSRYFDYDARGRLVATYLDGNVERTEVVYDPAGRVTITDAAGVAEHLFYNHHGLLARREDAAGDFTRYEYNENHQLVRTADSLGRETAFTRCDCGRPTTVTDPYGRTVLTFTLGGPNNAPTALTDANGNVTRYAYDAAGNPVRTTYADGTMESATYDAGGNLDMTTNRRGQTIDRTANAAGQVTHEARSDGTSVGYTYDARGRLRTATDARGTTTLAYDDADNLTRVEYPNGRWLEYRYDAAGRRTRLEDHTGFVQAYRYDAAGRLEELRDAADALVVRYTYDAAGRLTREDKGNGTYTVYGYDALGREAGITHHAPDGSVNSRFAYTYDAAGRRTTAATIDGTWTYTYDLTDQLVRAVFASANPAIPDQDLRYAYDALGNRVTTAVNGAATAYAADNMNRYTAAGGTTFKYDADGNLVAEVTPGGTRTFSYDLVGRLTRVQSPGGVWQYEYDVFGNRSAVVVNGVRTEFLIDPTGLGEVVGEYDGAGVRTAGYARGLGLEAATGADGYAYYDFDAIGSTAGVSAGAGGYANRYAYDPFGGTLLSAETVANPFEFVGQFGVMHDGNGLQFMRARYYSASLGRFTSEDPIQLLAGDPNYYRYVSNDPVNELDPTGLKKAKKKKTIGELLAECEMEVVRENICNKEEGGASASLIAECTLLRALFALTGNGAGVALKEIREEGSEPFTCPGNQNKGGLLDEGVDERGKGTTSTPSSKSPTQDDTKGKVGATGTTSTRGSKDPNEKLGAAGYGPAAFIPAEALIPYRINFENLGPGSVPAPTNPATAPAQRVEVTDQLSADLDWDTVAFTGFGFGDHVIAVSRGGTYHTASKFLTSNGRTVRVDVELAFDPSTGVVRAVFQAIDPATSLPPDVFSGILPPEDGTGAGKGFLSYTVRPKAGLPTGTEIRNVAVIVFDGQASIATNQVDPQDPAKGTDQTREALNTIDSGAPTSAVNPLPAVTRTPSFAVSWTGADDAGGSGVASYDVYVSENGGRFALWLGGTTATSGTYTARDDTTYAFYAVATDNVGHRQPTPASAQAVTTVRVNDAPDLAPLDDRAVDEGVTLTFTAVGTDPDAGDGLTYTLVGAPDGATIDPASGIFTWAPTEAQGPDAVTFTVRVTDDGTPARHADRAVTVTVREVNRPPALAPVENRAVVAGQTLTFTATATDPDLPANGLTFSLVGAPTGAAIDPATGVFAWTPATSTPASDYTFAVRVTDDGTPPLSAERTVTVSVSPSNQAPTDVTLSADSVPENRPAGAAVGTLSVTDPDAGDTHTLALVPGAGGEDNALFVLDGTTLRTAAVFDHEARSRYSVRVRATDAGGLWAERAFPITVADVNEAPALAPIADARVGEGSPVTFTAAATDPDRPAQGLTYTLDPGAPAGASIDPVTGVFTWVPADGPGTVTIRVRVTDGGTPTLSATQTFTVRVDNVAPAPTIADVGGPLAEGSAITVTGAATDPAEANDTLAYAWAVYKDGGAVPFARAAGVGLTGFTFTPDDDGSYRIVLTVSDEDGGSATAERTIAVGNVAPTIAPAAAGGVNQGSTYALTLGGLADPGADTASAVVVDWGDGTSTRLTADQVAALRAGGSVEVRHVYLQAGSYAVRVVVRDEDGEFGPDTSPSGGGSRTVAVSAVAGVSLEGGRLVVVGTGGDDRILVNPGNPDGPPTAVRVTLNGVDRTFEGVTEVLILANAGNDVVQVAGGVTLPVYAFGGAGNDRMKAGGGDAVLVGGDGDDLLIGGAGRDVLVGGFGADRIAGNAADDILIAGSTAFDSDLAGLAAIRAEWTSDRGFAERVANLEGAGTTGANGGVVLRAGGDAATVFDDGAADVLTGDAGADWFVFNQAGAGVADPVTDLTAFEAAYADELEVFSPYVGP